MHTRAARLGRGWVAAAFATFVAAFSHTIAGGAAPSVFAIAVSLVISGAACTLLAGRGISVVRLTVSVAVSQALFHGLFSSMGTPTPVAHAHTVDVVASGHEHATMWGAHAVAAVITIVALRYGEAAFWGMARIARMLVLRLLSWPVPSRALPSPTLGFVGEITPRRSHHLSIMRHRGPPRMAAA